MEEVLIRSNDDGLITDAKVLKFKAEFMALGFKSFPSAIIAKECPYKSPLKITEWVRSAGNVWRGRNRDKIIINAFENALERIKGE